MHMTYIHNRVKFGASVTFVVVAVDKIGKEQIWLRYDLNENSVPLPRSFV